MKNCIISGATGAIGTALIKELISNKIEVLVLCRKGSKRISKVPKSPLVCVLECSLDDYASLENNTGKKYDVFYHFAWDGTFGESRNNLDVQIRNVKYSVDAVRLAKRFGCKVFIGAGSQAEYGRVESRLRSDTPAFPENGYGIAKLCAGQMTRLEAKKLGLNHVWVRILSIFGPGDGENTLVMSVIRQLKDGVSPKCTKGEQVWDYLYSGDAARAFRLLGDKGRNGKTYVLGGGVPHLLREYIEEIRAVVNDKCAVEYGAIDYPQNQVMYLCADISELTDDIGFYANTDFKDGILSILNQV